MRDNRPFIGKPKSLVPFFEGAVRTRVAHDRPYRLIRVGTAREHFARGTPAECLDTKFGECPVQAVVRSDESLPVMVIFHAKPDVIHVISAGVGVLQQPGVPCLRSPAFPWFGGGEHRVGRVFFRRMNNLTTMPRFRHDMVVEQQHDFGAYCDRRLDCGHRTFDFMPKVERHPPKDTANIPLQ